MEFGNIAANFVGLCFVKIKSMKITKDGFDIEYTGFAYNSLIMDFVKRINEEKLVDKEIIDYGISWNDESLTAHFYDKDYYNPHEDKTDGELPPF